MDTWIYWAAALAIFLIGFAVGTVVIDFFSTRYWEREVKRMKKMHESELTSATVASFNEGVLAALPSKEDKEIQND